MILVTGGAGYIGSHMVKELIARGHDVVVFDDLSTGNRTALHSDAHFIEGCLRNAKDLQKVFQTFPIKAVMHFAANCYVGESVEQPRKYYENNVVSTINLLNEMTNATVRNLIFSSSCAVYGVPVQSNIDEEVTKDPISPYGRTKLIAENMITDYSRAYKLNYCFLRYFNVAGADPEGALGEDHRPETHLIPKILRHLSGRSDRMIVYGDDYDTPDGTCIRDYIHVSDLVAGHYAALRHLLGKKSINTAYNLGNGIGYSINEIIRMCEKVTGQKADVLYEKRRPGDPPRLIANADKAKRELNWKPLHDLEMIIETAWEWLRKHPEGYRSMEGESK